MITFKKIKRSKKLENILIDILCEKSLDSFGKLYKLSFNKEDRYIYSNRHIGRLPIDFESLWDYHKFRETYRIHNYDVDYLKRELAEKLVKNCDINELLTDARADYFAINETSIFKFFDIDNKQLKKLVKLGKITTRYRGKAYSELEGRLKFFRFYDLLSVINSKTSETDKDKINNGSRGLWLDGEHLKERHKKGYLEGFSLRDIQSYLNNQDLESFIIFKRQYNVTKFKSERCHSTYRIDAYIEKYKIAIECDENNHSGYYNDDIREEFIANKLGCIFIRYCPTYKNFHPEVIADNIYHIIKNGRYIDLLNKQGDLRVISNDNQFKLDSFINSNFSKVTTNPMSRLTAIEIKRVAEKILNITMSTYDLRESMRRNGFSEYGGFASNPFFNISKKDATNFIEKYIAYL